MEFTNKNFAFEIDLQWFAKDGPGGEKTEPATAKKLRDAREEGKVAKSKELTAAFDLIVLFLVLKIFVSFVAERLIGAFSNTYNLIPDFVEMNAKDVSGQAVSTVMSNALLQILIICLPFFAFGLAITLVISIYQVGWKVSAKPMKPKLDKFNPLNGFKRIFSKDSLFELLKSFLKIGLIIYIAYTSIRGEADNLFILYEIPLTQAVLLVGNVILDAGLKISIAYLVVGIADYIYQKHKFNEDMKMTKQEVKDEYKNTEGNPEIKGRQRQRMREVSQRRMMQDVPKADVVITNPTHYAVAIQYDAEKAKAPVVLAKGEDYLAQKIKEVAKENHVEIVENKPLARMLYANVDIGQEIPPELYQAVAEVLAMVYNTRQ
ncbi:MAG: flagellar biosynthesis protein FlhB [Lachnospiraceae bacterium]|nr:flagellar biosynthesis protein FlhB [Lachnospiraceae bacterium]